MNKTICVYSSSSNSIDPEYFKVARELGKAIAVNNDTLLFGGGMRGLMGATATAAHQNGGSVIGVIPEMLNVKGVVYEFCDELIITEDMRKRKSIMDSRSDAFIALPGGFGTYEELLEIITLKQLKYHNKPIVILNVNGYYDLLLKQFEAAISGHFAKEESRLLYYVTEDVNDALNYIANYKPTQFKDKWLT
jgi:uncharacterized protein (TIGR00730 family)